MTPAKLSTAFRAHAARSRPADRRVSEDEITAYVKGELLGEERERVEEAISLDPEAADLARDLALFHAEPPGPGEPWHLSAHELASDWKALRKRLPSHRTELVRWAIAASLVAVALPAISLWGWSQRNARLEGEQRLAAALQPQVNVEAYTLWEPTPRGTAPAQPRAVTLRARGEAFWLRLGVVDKPRYDDYRLEVSALDRPAEPLLWRRDGLTLYPDGSFSVAFPRAALPPGTYELRLMGLDGGTEARLATYRIRIPQPPAAE